MVNRRMLEDEINNIKSHQLEIEKSLNKLRNYFDEL